MTKTIKKIFTGVVVTLLISGCAMMGPDYIKVEPEVPQAWHSQLTGGLMGGQVDSALLAQWWQGFNDPVLASLEDGAVQGNLDLQEARARVREARALRGGSRAGLFPSLNAMASATKSRSSGNVGGGGEAEMYSVGFDAGWELDIFGGKRRALEAAQADLEASRAALRDVLVSLTAEVGINYVDVRAYQARLAAARDNLAAQQNTYELNESRYQAGLIAELAVQQSRYNLERTRSQIPQLETGLAQVMNRLAVLLGKRPGALQKKLAQVEPVPTAPIAITVGIPAAALRRRPDIRQAERELAAQTARIGAATADLYPKFQLSGSIGLESMRLENLPEWASRLFRIGPSFSWNIFDAGMIRCNIEVQNARQEQALVRYKTTVLEALEEVENALTSFVKEQDRLNALTHATAAAGKADQVARDRYQAGLVDFSNVLDAQRSLLSFQDELAQSTGAVTADLIRLYKTLGGGWVAEDRGQDDLEKGSLHE